MSNSEEENKNQPDSRVMFQKKKIGDIHGYATTKFGQKALVKVSVNREQKCFDVFVKDVNESDINDFEQLWTMCKVYALKSVKRSV